jgi:hypothetical protein
MSKTILTAVIVAGLLAGAPSAEAAKKKQQDQAQPAPVSQGSDVIERVTRLPDPAPPMTAPMKVVPLNPASTPTSVSGASASVAPQTTVARELPPPPPPPPIAPVRVPVWVAPEGSQLRAVLNAWGEEAGWKVVWNSPYAFTLRASVEFEGSFDKAAETLIEAFADARPSLFATFHEGNRVIVITTPHDTEVN